VGPPACPGWPCWPCWLWAEASPFPPNLFRSSFSIYLQKSFFSQPSRASACRPGTQFSLAILRIFPSHPPRCSSSTGRTRTRRRRRTLMHFFGRPAAGGRAADGVVSENCPLPLQPGGGRGGGGGPSTLNLAFHSRKKGPTKHAKEEENASYRHIQSKGWGEK